MTDYLPAGFRCAGAYCGIKSNPNGRDLTLIEMRRPTVAAGVYTQNKVFAAPVGWDRTHTPSDRIRAIVANSGNANACTGRQGERDVLQMARWAAEACGAEPDQVLVMSTGVIGQTLPMEKIAAGIRQAADNLDCTEDACRQAASGLLTTDTRRKIATRQVDHRDQGIRIVGLAKGSGMIGPKMATMLGVLMTDARLAPDQAQQLLQDAVDVSFNCISVEGHTSTNDTVLLVASGEAGPLDTAAEQDAFATALRDCCVELARAIPDDGEGASHLITIDVLGCDTRVTARSIAESIANSALVKTAMTGADPNWGRIVSAAGYAGVEFDPAVARLRVNGALLFERGEPVDFDGRAVSESIANQRETHIELTAGRGPAAVRFWTSDLTVEYVRFNAEYHT